MHLFYINTYPPFSPFPLCLLFEPSTSSTIRLDSLSFESQIPLVVYCLNLDYRTSKDVPNTLFNRVDLPEF